MVTSLVSVLCVYGKFVRTSIDEVSIHPGPEMKESINDSRDRKKIK
jgi:hypothetical protein